jgi:hypothetical protein
MKVQPLVEILFKTCKLPDFVPLYLVIVTGVVIPDLFNQEIKIGHAGGVLGK